MTPERRDGPALGWLLALVWLVGAAAATAGELLDGELARWIDDTVAPELGETLSRHPRFEGETVRLVTLVPDAAPGTSNALARALELRLRQRLLEVEGVRLAADAPRRGCEPPRRIDYLVRLELAPSGSRGARAQVAVVDVAEAVWVSGISHQWQGRLSAAERRAMNEVVSTAEAGTAGGPIPVTEAADVAAVMQANLACLLPRDLEGAIYVVTPEDPALARVTLALQRTLMMEPLAAVTADRDAADWLLTLSAAGDAADVRELALTLSDAGGGGALRVASVFVSGAGGAPPQAVAAAPQPRPAPEPEPASAPADAPAAAVAADGTLLSALQLVPARRNGVCDSRRARVLSCAEITFELYRPAHLFVLSTQDHRVVEAPCAAAGESDAGTRRFRLRLPPTGYGADPADTGPDAGFYVLATRRADVAERLHETLVRAPGQCGTTGGDAAEWLGELSAVLERHGETVDWQALHLVHGRAGIAAL